MKKVLLYSLLALLTVLNGATVRAFQANKASDIKLSRPPTKKAAPCVGKAGRRLANKDAEVNSLVAHVESFTNALVRLVNDAANPADGADAAQRYMDKQRPGLSAEIAETKTDRECQLSNEVRESSKKRLYQDAYKVGQLNVTHGSDPATAAKLKKLTDDFLEIFGAMAGVTTDTAIAALTKNPCEGKTGPKRDAEIEKFMAVINSFTDELVGKVQAGPTRSEGVDEAQRHMDKEKGRVKALFNSMKGIGMCDVSEQTKKTMKDNFFQDGVKIGQLTAKYGSDPAVKTKLQKLTQDFLSLFQM